MHVIEQQHGKRWTIIDHRSSVRHRWRVRPYHPPCGWYVPRLCLGRRHDTGFLHVLGGSGYYRAAYGPSTSPHRLAITYEQYRARFTSSVWEHAQ